MAEDPRYIELLNHKIEQLSKSEGPAFEAAAPAGARRAGGRDPEAPDLEAAGGRPEAARAEAIIRWYRPVLWVKADAPDDSKVFTDPNFDKSRPVLEALRRSAAKLRPLIPAIGRIEVLNNSQFDWLGTGWIVDSDGDADIVITNNHVAEEFARRSGSGFLFRAGTIDFGKPQSARIDFREEIEDSTSREFQVTDIIWMSENATIDVAFLRVERNSGEDRLSPPIGLSAEDPKPGRKVAVVGYPGDNSRSYDAEKFERIFGRMFGKKRLAPGLLNEPHEYGLTHDCSTLPGNSGSVLIDIDAGKALGLHYSGSIFRANYAVPASEIIRLIRERPWQGGEAVSKPTPSKPATDGGGSGGNGPVPPKGTYTPDGSMRFVVPIEITVRIGGQAPAAHGDTSVAAGSKSAVSDREAATKAAAKVAEQLRGHANILAIKADYLVKDGRVTQDYGVIVKVAPGASLDPATYGLESAIDGVPASVEPADPLTVAAELFGVRREAFGGRTARYKRDLSDARFKLEKVPGKMQLTLHVSPEAGWPMLRQFLARKDCDQLTIGMYHMTAPHIVEAIQAVAERPDRIVLTLDRQRGEGSNPDDTGSGTKTKDIPEKKTLRKLKDIAGDEFDWTKASLGGSGLFPTAYHIKVAVWSKRKNGKLVDKAFWLSSGNWQSSNQAPLDIEPEQIGELSWSDVRDYNREWHAVVEHEGLARILRNHLEQDYADNRAASRSEARVAELPDILVPDTIVERVRRPGRFEAFPPLVIDGEAEVQILLTPDNYPEVVLGLLAKARERILIENQSFSLWSNIEDTPEHFLKLARMVQRKQADGLDVRIIIRSGYGNEVESLRRMQEIGLKTDAEHVRYFDTCHTKGIVIDDDIAILGSQNWTAAGTGPNRDASLAVWHPDANKYFAKLFEYDWKQVAVNEPRPEGVAGQAVKVLSAGREAAVPAGYRRISLAEYLGET